MRKLLNMLERIVAYSNGKGFGTSSLVAEVACVKRFVKGGILFDVGANKGAYARALLDAFGDTATRIICFEPSEELVKTFLHFNDTRISVINSALGRTKGTVPFYASESDSGLGSLTKRRLTHFGLEMKKVQDVQVITLDDFAISNGIDRIDLLKLDVEGHELDVLEGGKNLLLQNRIGCIQFEFGGCNIDTRTFFQDFWYLLAENHEFEIYRIAPWGMIKVNRYREMDEMFVTTNYVAVNNSYKNT